MVEWSPEEVKTITGIFSSMDYKDIGPKGLCRCLIVYPWTQRYFASFGNLSDANAIKTNAKIANHGVTVLRGLELAAKDLNNIKSVYTKLSTLHSEKLQVDPDNFKLLTDCLTVVIAAKMGDSFTPETHATLQKFMAVAVSALVRQYH